MSKKADYRTTNVAGLTRHLDDPAKLRIASGARVLDFIIELQERMDAKDITQAELARRMGVSRQQVSRWLAAESGMTAKSMFCLAAGLGFDLTFRWDPRLRKARCYNFTSTASDATVSATVAPVGG